jgi:ABC-type multidrug transport system fused ATPase/permease subunit
MKERTVIAIAHRLPTLRRAGRILMIENGRVVETGTFDGLMQRDGVFAEFARATFPAGGTDASAVESDAAE